MVKPEAESFVSLEEFLGAAESFTSSCMAADSLPASIAADVMERLRSEMTILAVVSLQVYSTLAGGSYSETEFATRIAHGLQYVRLLQALGLDVRNMRAEMIKGDELSEVLESFTAAAAAASRLIDKILVDS
jgi:hypothetical protein